MTLHLGAAIAHISSIRTDLATRTGCTEWDNGGIKAAFLATEGAPADVSAAACLAAGDPGLNYPSAAAFKAHWPKNASAPPRVSNDVSCPDHGDPMPCRHRDHTGDMTLEQIAAAKAECLAIAEAAREEARRRQTDIETRRQENP